MATILVVDDRPINIQFLTTLLGYTGHRVVAASDGIEALEIVKNECPDLAIVDILMPNMDGVDFVREMRKALPGHKPDVLFYTATHQATEARQLATSVGVQHVLQKPAPPQEILKMVGRLLGGDSAPVLPVPDTVAAAVQRADAGLDIPELLLKSEYFNTRLAALIELNLELASENDPQRLLQMTCAATRRIVEAERGAAGIVHVDGDQLLHFVSDAAEGTSTPNSMPPDPRAGVLGELIETRSAQRYASDGQFAMANLPDHNTIRSFLGVPILSPIQCYGWMYFTERSGSQSFSIDDERLAMTTAAHLGVVLENARLVQQLERTTDSLKRSNENLLQFTSLVSHDIKAPLRGLDQLILRMQRDESVESSGQWNDNLKTMRTRIERMQRMVDDLLQYMRIDKQRLANETVRTGSLVHEMVDLLAPPSGFTIDIADDLPTLTTPRAPLDLVLRNLIGNAVKHHNRTDGRITVTSSDAGPFVMFSVADDGPGIPAQFQERIFREFATLRPRHRINTNGLGLSLVKKTVETYGGRIGLESTVGLGSRFFFTWPRDPVRETSHTASSVEASSPPAVALQAT